MYFIELPVYVKDATGIYIQEIQSFDLELMRIASYRSSYVVINKERRHCTKVYFDEGTTIKCVYSYKTFSQILTEINNSNSLMDFSKTSAN